MKTQFFSPAAVGDLMTFGHVLTFFAGMLVAKLLVFLGKRAIQTLLGDHDD